MAGVAGLMQNMSPAERSAFILRLNEGNASNPNQAPSVAPGAGGMGGLGRAIDSVGGFSTFGSLAGMGLGTPLLGLLGSGIDVARDYGTSQQFDPSYSPGLSGVVSGIGNEFTRGLLGRSMLEQAVSGYQGRTGTGLNQAALGAFAGGAGRYSGPKGVSGPRRGSGSRLDRGGGGGASERGGDNRGPGHGPGHGRGSDEFGGPR